MEAICKSETIKCKGNTSILTFVNEADVSDTLVVLRGELDDVTLQTQPLVLKHLGALSQCPNLLLHRADANLLRRFTLKYV